MNRTDRLYAIVEELRGAGAAGRTAERLARHFEVTTRTIKRDVAALQQGGVPIWATSGPGGGYALDGAATLPPLTFTVGEATAVAIALATQRDLPFRPDGRSALTKLMAAMTPDGRASASELASRVWLRDDDASRTPVTRAIEEALRQQVVVVLDYVDRDGRRTEKRPVEPMAFTRAEAHWYLLAWCRRRRGGRWFRLDRIAAAWPTAEAFRVRDMIDVFGEPPEDARPLRLQ